MVPELFGAAVWAMPGVTAMEESSASRPSGAAFKRNPCDRAPRKQMRTRKYRRGAPIIFKI